MNHFNTPSKKKEFKNKWVSIESFEMFRILNSLKILNYPIQTHSYCALTEETDPLEK